MRGTSSWKTLASLQSTPSLPSGWFALKRTRSTRQVSAALCAVRPWVGHVRHPLVGALESLWPSCQTKASVPRLCDITARTRRACSSRSAVCWSLGDFLPVQPGQGCVSPASTVQSLTSLLALFVHGHPSVQYQRLPVAPSVAKSLASMAGHIL